MGLYEDGETAKRIMKVKHELIHIQYPAAFVTSYYERPH